MWRGNFVCDWLWVRTCAEEIQGSWWGECKDVLYNTVSFHQVAVVLANQFSVSHKWDMEYTFYSDNHTSVLLSALYVHSMQIFHMHWPPEFSSVFNRADFEKYFSHNAMHTTWWSICNEFSSEIFFITNTDFILISISYHNQKNSMFFFITNNNNDKMINRQNKSNGFKGVDQLYIIVIIQFKLQFTVRLRNKDH